MPLPEIPGPARDEYILEAKLDYKWAKVTISIPGHTGVFAVFERPAKVDGIYVGVGARVLQMIADQEGCSLLTPKLQDQMYAQSATKIVPWLDYTASTIPGTNPGISKMQSTTWFRRSTAGIDAMLAAQGYTSGLAMGIGKPWQLDNALTAHPGKAENFGLYVPASKAPGGNYLGVRAYPTPTLLPGVLVLQQPGTEHGLEQDDYSQLISLVSRNCVVDDSPRDFSDVIRDPALAPLVSHQGALKIVRQIGVPIAACKIATLGADTTGVGYGEDGKIVCPIKITGLPTNDGGEASSPFRTALAVTGVIAVASGAAWAVRKYRSRRGY